MKAEILCVGMGNPDRGDDGIGYLALQLLAAKPRPKVDYRYVRGAASELLDLWQGYSRVIAIDSFSELASTTTRPPLSQTLDVLRFDVNFQALPPFLKQRSTHELGLAEAIELGRALSQLPNTLIVFGCRGEQFDQGTEISPQALRGLNHLINQVNLEITQLSIELKESHA